MNFRWLQVETVREKRRREVQFSKAGLELPHAEKALAKRKRDDTPQNIDIEVHEDEICLPATEIYSDTDMQASHDELGTSDGGVGVLMDEVANDNTQPSLPEFEEKPQFSQVEEMVEPMVSNYISIIYFSSHKLFSCRK